jgi:anti-anti-sigma factor
VAEPGRAPLRWPLQLTLDTLDGIPVLIAAGRVSHASAAALTVGIDQAVGGAGTPAGVVLDLERVDYISSAGLRAIEAAAVRLAGRRAGFVLVAPPEPVRIALDLAGLLTRVTIEPSRALAVARIVSRPGL